MSERLRFQASTSSGEVSALLSRPEGADALLVLAHGAGAGMEHPFMADLAERLAGRGVATLRYQFPYMEQGRRRPDPPALAVATVRSAVAAAAVAAPGLPIFAGGKSFGGRMSSTAASKPGLEDVRGLVFFGFPLHAPAKPGNERAEHLDRVVVPMLFLQGTRDAFSRAEYFDPVIERLGERAIHHPVEHADHGFRVPKRSGRTAEDVMDELATEAAAFMRRVAGGWPPGG